MAGYCTEFSDIDIESVNCRHNCRYNREHGLHYNQGRIAPAGLCPDMFHTAYPYGLSLLYDGSNHFDGKASKNFILKCPAYPNYVSFEVRQEIFILKPLFRAIEWPFKMIRKPIEIIDRNIVIEVKKIHGTCAYGLKAGGQYVFNIGNSPELCPAAFNSLYPYLGIQKDEQGDKESCNASSHLGSAQCPDHKGKITFEIYNRPVDLAKVKTFKRDPWGVRALVEPVVYNLKSAVRGVFGLSERH